MLTTVLAEGGGIVMPDAAVVRQIVRLLGVVFWIVSVALIAAAMRSGVEVAAKYKAGEPVNAGAVRLIVIAVVAVLVSSATTWAGWILL